MFVIVTIDCFYLQIMRQFQILRVAQRINVSNELKMHGEEIKVQQQKICTQYKRNNAVVT